MKHHCHTHTGPLVIAIKLKDERDYHVPPRVSFSIKKSHSNRRYVWNVQISNSSP